MFTYYFYRFSIEVGTSHATDSLFDHLHLPLPILLNSVLDQKNRINMKFMYCILNFKMPFIKKSCRQRWVGNNDKKCQDFSYEKLLLEAYIIFLILKKIKKADIGSPWQVPFLGRKYLVSSKNLSFLKSLDPKDVALTKSIFFQNRN